MMMQVFVQHRHVNAVKITEQGGVEMSEDKHN